MGNYLPTESKKHDAVPKIAIETNVILGDVMFHLHSLESKAQSLISATDSQYELIQSFFDGKELEQTPDKLNLLSHKELNEKEKKTLAYLQDDICTQTLIIKKTVAHLGDLFQKFFGLPVDGKSLTLSKYENKKTKLDENVNQTRLERNYLKSEYERLSLQLTEIEKKLKSLFPQALQEAIIERNPTRDNDCRSKELLNEELAELEDTVKQKDEEIQKIKDRFDKEIAKRTKSLNDDIDTYKEKVCQLSGDMKDIRQKNDSLEKENRSLKRKLDQLEKDKNTEITSLKGELTKIKGQVERKLAQKTVFLYTHRRGELLSKVIVELKQMLELQFETQGMKLRIVDCENSSVIDSNKPILVLCINASRLGTDVSNALTGIQGNENVSVVVLHHKETHALPNQSSERVLTSMEYKSLGGIIDMAFLSNRGIYPCDMNNHAMSIILDFIIQRNK